VVVYVLNSLELIMLNSGEEEEELEHEELFEQEM